MGNRRTILILLAAIGCGAALLWWAGEGGPSPAEEVARGARLVGQPFDALQRLTLERGETRLVVARRAGRWELEAPFAAQVDQGAMARLTDALEAARVTDALSLLDVRRRELSLRDFGLAPAVAHVLLEGAGWQAGVQIGAASPLGAEGYVRLDGAGRLLSVPASLHRAIPLSADDLRSRKLLRGERARVRAIDVRIPGKPFVRLSKESGTWRLVQPVAAPASDERVETLLEALDAARVERFVWPTVSNVLDVVGAETALNGRLSLYGLGSETAVQLQLQEAYSEVPTRVSFGREFEGHSELCYVLLPGGEAIGTVSNAVVRAVSLTPSDLRDPRLFFERPDTVRRLTVYFGDLLFVVSRTNGVWNLQSPVSDVADGVAVGDAVGQLLRLRADTVSEQGQEASGERAVPLSHVEVATDQSSWRFSITPEDFEATHYRIVFTNSPTVFRVASSNVPPALVSLSGLLGFRDKAVLGLLAGSVRRIAVRRGETGESLQRADGEEAWRLGEGMRGRVESERVASWLAQVCALRADRVEKLGLTAAEAEVYGLRVPWLEVSLDVETADALRKTLLVGKEAGFGKRYAAVRGLDVLFVLDQAALELLESRLVDPL